MVSSNTRLAFAKQIYLCEIEFQARIAERAATRLPDGRTPFDSDDTWGAVQIVLSAAANISKILWPSSRSGREAHGAILRELLGVGEEHVLSSRAIRNHFEHYDERIALWLEQTASAAYTDQVIGDLSYFQAQYPETVHRRFDPISKQLYFRGAKWELGLVLGAITDVRRRCQQIMFL